jgi:hypothetical protein
MKIEVTKEDVLGYLQKAGIKTAENIHPQLYQQIEANLLRTKTVDALLALGA